MFQVILPKIHNFTYKYGYNALTKYFDNASLLNRKYKSFAHLNWMGLKNFGEKENIEKQSNKQAKNIHSTVCDENINYKLNLNNY